MSTRKRQPRRIAARVVRDEAAELAFLRPHPDHQSNGEELQYRNPQGRLSFIANYSKGLPHNNLGEVNGLAYRQLLIAFQSENPLRFERLRLGTPSGFDLTNPQAGLAFDLEGSDAQAVTMPPAPRIDEAENSAEMGELYWMALARDVAFTEYGTGVNTDDAGITQAAATSLSQLLLPNAHFSAFRGPKVGNAVTAVVTPGNPPPGDPAIQPTLFRGFAPGDLVGPYISQFLLKGTAQRSKPGIPQVPDEGFIEYGTLRIDQRQRTVLPVLLPPGGVPGGGTDFLTEFVRWRRVQNGRQVIGGVDILDSNIFDDRRRFIRNLRDLANYVHFDALYEAHLNACLLLLAMPVRFDPGNPYGDPQPQRDRTQQDGFGTFGPPHILTLVTEVATRALKAVWFQKWGVHRRLRPEEFGGRIHVHLSGVLGTGVGPGRYPMIDGEILNTGANSVLTRINAYNNNNFGDATFLLPQVFPEGAPTHPAYGAGHATVAGACVTVLKAWFDESEVFDPNVVAPLTPPNPEKLEQLRENRRPKVPNLEDEPAAGTASGTVLIDYVPPAHEERLTVGGELNKLAANISLGRNAAGVHWRSDYTESLRLGEEIAIRLLQEQKQTYNEDYSLSLTTFDGNAITI
jgi:hypothetical protein